MSWLFLGSPPECQGVPLLGSLLIALATNNLGDPRGFPGGSDSKQSACKCRRPRFDPWFGKNPLEGGMAPTPVFLPGELQSIGLQRVKHDWVSNTFTFHLVTHLAELSKHTSAAGTDRPEPSQKDVLEEGNQGSCEHSCVVTCHRRDASWPRWRLCASSMGFRACVRRRQNHPVLKSLPSLICFIRKGLPSSPGGQLSWAGTRAPASGD